jgi:hypothetical protein
MLTSGPGPVSVQSARSHGVTAELVHAVARPDATHAITTGIPKNAAPIAFPFVDLIGNLSFFSKTYA